MERRHKLPRHAEGEGKLDEQMNLRREADINARPDTEVMVVPGGGSTVTIAFSGRKQPERKMTRMMKNISGISCVREDPAKN